MALQCIELNARFIGRRRLVDAFERSHHSLGITGRDVAQARAHQVHDAQLRERLGEHRLHRLGQPFEAIHAGNVDVLHAPVAQFGEYRQPELGAFAIGQPQAQHLLVALQIHAQHHVGRFVDHLLVVLHLDDHAVQPHDGVDRLQRSALPGARLVKHRIGYRGDQRVRDLHAYSSSNVASMSRVVRPLAYSVRILSSIPARRT